MSEEEDLGDRRLHGYEELGGECLVLWEREHRNGDRTQVLAVDASNGPVLVIAVDLDERDEPLASELVATSLTRDEARQRARAWIEENEMGVDNGGNGVRDLLNL